MMLRGDNTQESGHETASMDVTSVNISFIIEWANTTYNGVPRFFTLVDILARQWRAMINREYPAELPVEAMRFLERINTKPEVIVVSGEQIAPELREKITQYAAGTFEPGIHVKEGLEYYALKNFGANMAHGDLICFLDSDVHPDEGWLTHLLGTFSNAKIYGAAGQPYVKPVDLMSRAFALGWTYELADETGRIFTSEKFYANNVVFRSEVFRRVRGFPHLQRRTRGAGTLLSKELIRQGCPVWQNRKALVDHPAPSSWKHLVVRALAHGRDKYMKNSEQRSWEGFFYCQRTVLERLRRGFLNTYHYWHKVGLNRVETVPVIMIITCYYAFFSLGGILTHISPEIMGRRFRL